jgi:hypothetical protein
MERREPLSVGGPPEHFRDVSVEARRRRLNRVLSAALLGCVLAAFTLGALAERVIAEDQNDLLPVPLEALLLGAFFAVGSLPVAWSIIGRIMLPVPTFFLYFTVLIGKADPLPFYAAFALAGIYSAALTALARQLADRPVRAVLGSRGPGHREKLID